jgi:hypothetical protein
MPNEEEQEKPQRFTIYIAPLLLARLRRAAQRERRSVNAEIQWLIEQGLPTEDEEKSTHDE